MEISFNKSTDIESINALLDYVQAEYGVSIGDTVKFSKGGVEVNGEFIHDVTRLFMNGLVHLLLDKGWAFLDATLLKEETQIDITESEGRKVVSFTIGR